MRGRRRKGRLSEPIPLSSCIGSRVLVGHIILWGRCWLFALHVVTESSSVREIILLKPSQGERRPHHGRELSCHLINHTWCRHKEQPGQRWNCQKISHWSWLFFRAHVFLSVWFTQGRLFISDHHDQSRGSAMGKVALGFLLPSRTSEVSGKRFLSITGHKTDCALSSYSFLFQLTSI